MLGAQLAPAQSYPSRPIRLIAPSSPGSGVDIVARIVGQKLSENLKQQVVIDNRAGAGANLGAEIAAKAAPDGYTLFMGTPAHAINTSLYRRLNYDIVKDFAPISLVTSGQYVAGRASFPAGEERERVDRACPGPARAAQLRVGGKR